MIDEIFIKQHKHIRLFVCWENVTNKAGHRIRKKTKKTKRAPDRKNPIVDMGETRLPPASDNALKVQRFSWE